MKLFVKKKYLHLVTGYFAELDYSVGFFLATNCEVLPFR